MDERALPEALAVIRRAYGVSRSDFEKASQVMRMAGEEADYEGLDRPARERVAEMLDDIATKQDPA